MPKKKAAKLTDPRLPGKQYVTERGLKQALDALDKREQKKAVTTAEETVKTEQPNPEPARAERPVVEFIRNNYHTPFSLRLERHEGKRRIELKPRGERGDLAPIKPEDLNDPALIDNVNIGVIELISAGEAAQIAGKQTINQQKVHPALAILRNPLGEEYGEDAISVEIPFEEQGIVVAELEDGNVVVDRGGIRRKRARGQEPGTPDYITGAENIHAPAGEEAAFLSDIRARSKTLEGPEAGLGGIQRVTVAPTQSGE